MEPTKTTPHFMGHRKRLRDRFLKNNIQGFHDYEILELLLTYVLPRIDVKPIAKNLIQHGGSFSDVLDADIAALKRVNGMGLSSALFLKLLKSVATAYHAGKMNNQDVVSAPFLVHQFANAELAGETKERFLVIYLNTQNKVIRHELLQEGTVDHAVVYPRQVFESALRCHATGLIFVHNHPSGSLDPSKEDIQLTQTLTQLGQAMDIRVLDHIIVGKQGFFSLREHKPTIFV